MHMRVIDVKKKDNTHTQPLILKSVYITARGICYVSCISKLHVVGVSGKFYGFED
jgi:hypothetical protein